MKDFVADLFFHFFIMMMIPFINIILSRYKKGLKTNSIFLLTILFSLILSMSFPVKVGDGIAFDLKFIPVFISFFYIGPIAGGITVVAILGVNILEEHMELLVLFINYLIITPLFGFVYKCYQIGNPWKKLCIGIAFYLLITGSRTIALIQSGHSNDFVYLFSFSIVSFLTLAIIIYLIEMNKLQIAMLEQLQNADKLNAVSQLAASVAHEIRNPMTTIRGFLQILKDEDNLTSKQGMFLSISLDELDRTQNIIGDFLSLARPTNNYFESISLSQTLVDVAQFMHPFAVMSNVNLITNIEGNLVINGNTNECKQVFINLIKNAIEAMPSGGNLELFAYKENENAIINITDEGIGIDPIQIKQLGQPYYSTKTKGTGLGLMISFDIIKRMNGDYKIISKVNVGTTFHLSFPM
ncbi:ATP-binding protein [Cytobacillus sp.]|uniref:ATP-binding protein n=1 Tax=Cytobacillus sp. TaxID=2675269 RepID=UPI0028BDA406|nr:ATP-binding protein [Cytobacillus sp.]